MTHSPYDPHPAPGPSGTGGWGQPAPGAAPDATAGAGTATGAPAPGKDLGADLAAGLRFALDALLRNPVALLLPGVLYGLLGAILLGGSIVLGFVLAWPQMEAAAYSDEPPLGVLLTVYGLTLLGGLLCSPLALFWQSGAARAGEVIVTGRRPTIGQAMIGTGRLLLTLLLVGVIVFVGMLLFYLPGIVASVALTFALPAAARGASPVEAVKESLSLVKNNLGTTIVMILIGSAIGSVAGLFLITFVVLIPFLVLFHLGMYERLSGRELAEPVRA